MIESKQSNSAHHQPILFLLLYPFPSVSHPIPEKHRQTSQLKNLFQPWRLEHVRPAVHQMRTDYLWIPCKYEKCVDSFLCGFQGFLRSDILPHHRKISNMPWGNSVKLLKKKKGEREGVEKLRQRWKAREKEEKAERKLRRRTLPKVCKNASRYFGVVMTSYNVITSAVLSPCYHSISR